MSNHTKQYLKHVPDSLKPTFEVLLDEIKASIDIENTTEEDDAVLLNIVYHEALRKVSQ